MNYWITRYLSRHASPLTAERLELQVEYKIVWEQDRERRRRLYSVRYKVFLTLASIESSNGRRGLVNKLGTGTPPSIPLDCLLPPASTHIPLVSFTKPINTQRIKTLLREFNCSINIKPRVLGVSIVWGFPCSHEDQPCDQVLGGKLTSQEPEGGHNKSRWKMTDFLTRDC